jgi:putative transposase
MGGKKVAGRKRHVLVDTLGLIWGLAVLPADTTDWVGAIEVIRRAGRLPRLVRVWADSAYRALAGWATQRCRWVLEIVTRRDGAVGFEVIPKRWVVERTFGWLGRFRRLARDYERLSDTLAGWHWLAFLTLLLPRLGLQSA